jgi:hypothetical protein
MHRSLDTAALRCAGPAPRPARSAVPRLRRERDRKPVSDIQQYGLDDYWASPLEMLTSHAGDCEDYAIAKYVALQAAGLAPDDLRLVIVRDLRHQATHAVLAVHQDGEWLLLDNRTLVMVSANEVRGYLPLYVLDQGGVRAVASAPTQAPMGTLCRAITVRIARNDHENGAPGEIRTPDPQIRSLGAALDNYRLCRALALALALALAYVFGFRSRTPGPALFVAF